MIVRMKQEATREQVQAILASIGPRVVVANVEPCQPPKIVIRGYRDRAEELMAEIRAMPGVDIVGITGV